MSVKGLGEDIRLRDPGRKVISTPDDERLSFLLELADTVDEMRPEKQGQRKNQLTIDTARAFSHTCRGTVDMTKHLLSTTRLLCMPWTIFF